MFLYSFQVSHLQSFCHFLHHLFKASVSFGTTIIWLPTILFRKRFPLHPISVDCINMGKSEEQLPLKSCRLTVRRLLTNSWPTVGRLLVDCWQHVGNVSAKCRLRTPVEYQKMNRNQQNVLQCTSSQEGANSLKFNRNGNSVNSHSDKHRGESGPTFGT